MPELPDVETFRRYVDATSLHHRIDEIEIDTPRMLKGVTAATLRSRLKGAQFKSTARHGKFLLVEFGDGGWLVLHFGMTGYLEYRKSGEDIPEHTRLIVHFGNDYRLAGIWQRRLGRISLTRSPAHFVQEEGLGPDAWEPGIALDDFRRMIRERRGSIKSALMDQAFIAGIGNVYSDEMLFQSHIHPGAAANSLDEGQLAELHAKMLHVLRVAIERQADPERLPESWLLPRREDGQRCPVCRGEVKSLKVSGRTSYICPSCQAKPSSS